jgi:predicted MFS family arabinose efflux permease
MTAAGADAELRRRQRLALWLLFFVSFFNYLDRYLLGILLPAIKLDLRLTDTELGFISGIAFAIFYAAMGIPIGRFADRSSRRLVIVVSVATWSAMTALCGLARNFVQLALARVLVGIGEAGGTPPSHSLIADLFPAQERARALSRYAIGSPIGLFVGFAAGGVVAERFGWRVALFSCAAPGLVLAALLLWRLPEPARRRGVPGSPMPPWSRVLGHLVERRSLLHVALGAAYYGLLWYGLIAWLPSYVTRSFGLPLGEVGARLAVVLGGSQLIGLLAGGIVGDRLARRDARWYSWICALSVVLPIPCYALAFLAPSPDLVFAALFLALLIGLLQGGPCYAVVQNAVGSSMRATVTATYLVIVNVIGGFGAQFVGALSDRLAPAYGTASLRIALLVVTVGFSVLSAWHFWWGARYVRSDFQAAVAE